MKLKEKLALEYYKKRIKVGLSPIDDFIAGFEKAREMAIDIQLLSRSGDWYVDVLEKLKTLGEQEVD